FPLDLDSTVQRVDRLPMEEEREAGQHDVTNIEGAVHRTDPETRGLLVVLEFADDARFSRHIAATAAAPSAPSATATAHVGAREGRRVRPGLAGNGAPGKGPGVVPVIQEG